MPWKYPQLAAVLRQVQYRQWQFRVQPKGDGFLLQPRFVDPEQGLQGGRKWYISSHATKSEVVQTAFKACLTAEEHEVREYFTYKGQRIFSLRRRYTSQEDRE